MDDILGGAFTSRINMNLREDKTWSYGADTTIVDTQAQRPFLAIAPVQADKTAPSMREIKKEFDEFLSSRAATEAEVATSKRRSTLTLPGRWETARAVARDIAALVRFKFRTPTGTITPSSSRSSRWARSTGGQRLLQSNRLTWVVVGDRKVIEAEVRALNFGAVSIVDVDGNPSSP